MDEIDKKIIKILQKNARTTNTQIAKQLKMVPSGILERIRKLEKKQIISKYTINIPPKACELNLLAFITIKANSSNWSEEFETEIIANPFFEEIHEILGEDSYIIKVRAKNMDHLSEILKKKFGKMKEVKSTKTTMVIKTLKENGDFPINE